MRKLYLATLLLATCITGNAQTTYPTSGIFYSFIGNLCLNSGCPAVTAYADIRGNNGGQVVYATPDGAAVPWPAGTINLICLNIDNPNQPASTWTLEHKVGGVWVDSPLVITVPLNGPSIAHCSDPTLSVISSGAGDALALKLSPSALQGNDYTDFSISFSSSTPQYPLASVSSGWSLPVQKLKVCTDDTDPCYIELAGFQTGSYPIDAVAQTAAGKAGVIGPFCMLGARRTSDGATTVGLNINGTDSPLVITLNTSTTNNSIVCDNNPAHFTTVAVTDLLTVTANTTATSTNGINGNVVFEIN